MNIRMVSLLGCLTATACANGPPPLQSTQFVQVVTSAELPPPTQRDLIRPAALTRVGPNDKLMVDVYGFENLSQRVVQVDTAGQIAFPLAGTIDVAGKTTEEVATLLAVRMRANHVREPQVTVNIQESVSQTITVDGQVAQPGIYPVVGQMTLLRVIAAARGLSEFAKVDDVVVFRVVEGQRMGAAYNLGAIRRGIYSDPEMYANDVVVVGDSPSRRRLRDIIQAAPLLTAPILFLAR